MSEIEIKLHVGDTLRIEGPDGSMATYLVQQITASSGSGDDWVTTTPLTGQVALTLVATEPRTGEWAQDTIEATPTVRAGRIIDMTEPR